MRTSGDKPCEMGHIYKQERSTGVGNFPKSFKVEDAGIGRIAGYKNLGLAGQGLFLKCIVVKLPGGAIKGIGLRLKKFTGDRNFCAMCQVSSMRQGHAKDGVAWA